MNAGFEFFDCSARIGRPTVYRKGDVTMRGELIAEMDYAGVDAALVYHTLAAEWSPPDGNRALLEELDGEPRLYPCFVGLPDATREMSTAEDAAALVRARHGAVRLFPNDHSFSLREWTTAASFDALATHRVPVMIHIGQTNWSDLAHLLSAHDNLPVILLGTYYRVDRYLYPLWERHSNLYLETTTYQTFRGIETVCERFGHERLVFGTNIQELEIGGAISGILYAGISDEAKAAIAGGNLKRLLGIA